jgi:putative membrane protein
MKHAAAVDAATTTWRKNTMHRTHTILLAAGFAAAISGTAYAQTPGDTRQTAKPQMKEPASSTMTADHQFAHKAAMGGKKEVASAKFAAGKTSNASVKALANKLVTDHTAANNELMAMMKTKHIAPEKETKAEPEAWRSQSGAGFDRAWVDHVIADHEKDIAMFEAEAKDGSDAELKAWAEKKLPTLREHLKMAQDVKSKLSTTTNQ